MGCFILIYAQLSFDVCVVDASHFVVDFSSSGGYFVNNILVFRGGIKIVQRRKKVVFWESKSRGEMNKKTLLEEGKNRI